MRAHKDSRVDEEKRVSRYTSELKRIFVSARSKHQAHERSRPVLEDISTDPIFIRAILRRYLADPKVLNAKNYPVIGVNIELSPHYHLVANCWIPLPNHEKNISTKTIHHHGTMLLTTTTVFGPGYEHWLFTQPNELDPVRELYEMEVTDRKLHRRHDVAFVDAFEPHLPFYPAGLTVTLALWSTRNPTTWKDRLKRIPVLKANEATLRCFLRRAGLAKKLELKRAEYFDFYPTDVGFKGMKDRVEFGLGPNEDYLQSLFHVLQETQNDGLGPLVEQHLNSGKISFTNSPKIKRLMQDLKDGRSIEGKLSDCHLGVPHATFKSQDIDRTVTALRAVKKGVLPKGSLCQPIR